MLQFYREGNFGSDHCSMRIAVTWSQIFIEAYTLTDMLSFLLNDYECSYLLDWWWEVHVNIAVYVKSGQWTLTIADDDLSIALGRFWGIFLVVILNLFMI